MEEAQIKPITEKTTKHQRYNIYQNHTKWINNIASVNFVIVKSRRNWTKGSFKPGFLIETDGVMMLPLYIKWRAYLILVHRRNGYKDKKKTMSNVKYIYLFCKVNNCSDLVAYGRNHTRGELTSCPVSQSVNLLSVGRSPSRGCSPIS